MSTSEGWGLFRVASGLVSSFLYLSSERKGSLNILIPSLPSTAAGVLKPGWPVHRWHSRSTGRLPVLNHAHGHPVTGVHVFPNQVLEHDECLHQEVLQKCRTHLSPHVTGTDCTCLDLGGNLNAFFIFL